MANNYLDSFERRHIGIIASEKNEMLKSIGVSSLDELINKTVPMISEWIEILRCQRQ